MGGKELKKWFQGHCNVGDRVDIEILSPTALNISRYDLKSVTYKPAEGKVDITKEHIRISYKDDPQVVALVAPAENGSFVYDFRNKAFSPKQVSKKVLSAVLRILGLTA